MTPRNKQLVVITRPDLYEGEAEQIKALLQADSHFILHLRKPQGTVADYRHLLQQIPAEELERICLCDHFELAAEFEVGGVHLSSRNSRYEGNREIRVSRSCHSIAELEQREKFAYVFLSPLFNSISKQGYSAAFSAGELTQATQDGRIDAQVFALGGICPQTLPQLRNYGFGGVAVLGYVWQNFEIERFKKLVKIIEETRF